MNKENLVPIEIEIPEGLIQKLMKTARPEKLNEVAELVAGSLDAEEELSRIISKALEVYFAYRKHT